MRNYTFLGFRGKIEASVKQIMAFLGVLCLSSCSAPKYLLKTEVKEIVKDTIVYVEVPKEKIIKQVPLIDTLIMETSVAKSISYLDTATCQLKGQMENKPVKIEKEIQIKEVQKETIKEVEIEKKYIPKFYSFTLYWFIITIISLIIFIIYKLF